MSAFGANTAASYRVVLLVTILAAFGLRCIGLDSQELRGDEAFGYFFSLAAPFEIVDQTLDLNEPHPVASYWLQHVWLGWAGHSEFALRFTGVWWSVLAVALMVPLAGQLKLPPAAGALAAVLMALSPYVIWHAQDARMYSMSLALTMTSTLLAIRWWRAEGRSQQLGYGFCYLLVTWIALHTHYFALYVVVAHYAALGGLAFVARAWRKLAIWCALGVGLLLLWLPWLLAAWSTLLTYEGNGDSPGLVDALVRAFGAFGGGESAPGTWRWLWAVVTAAAMALGAAALWRMPGQRGRKALWFLAMYGLIPLLATWLSAQSRPIFNERYLVAAVPPVYLLIGAAVPRVYADIRLPLWAGRAMAAFVLAAMILGIVLQVSDPSYSKTKGWRELAAALTELSAGVEPDRVRLAQNYPDPTLWYYYRGDVVHLVLPPAAHDLEGARREVGQMADDGVGRVLLVEQPAEAWDADELAGEALSDEYSLAGERLVVNWPVSIWLRPPEELETLEVNYEQGLQLAGAAVMPSVVNAGGVVEVYLRWQGEAESIGDGEAVSIQLLDERGELVAQSDRPLEKASVTTAQATSYAILLPETLAGGDYSLIVVVYDPSEDGAPRRLTQEGHDHYRLGVVNVLSK